MSSRLPTRDHAARCGVLSRVDSGAIDAPCVLSSLGVRTSEAWQQHLGGH